MTPRSGAVEPDRRSAHFLSLLPWTRDDLDRVRCAADGPRRGEPGSRRDWAGATVAWLDEAGGAEHRESLSRACQRLGAALVERRDPVSSVEPSAARLAGDRAACVRVDRHARLLHLARRAPAPVLSTGSRHGDPLRVFADLHRLHREGREVDELTVLWAGGPTPELTSWLEASTRYRFTLALTLPGGARPDPALLAFVRTRAKGTLIEGAGRALWERADVLVEGAGTSESRAAAARVPASAVRLGREGRTPDLDLEADLFAALLLDLRRRWDAR